MGIAFRRLTVADAGEALTVQRAAFLAEADLYGTTRIPPLMDDLAEVQAQVAATVTTGAFLGPRLVGAARLTVDGAVGWVSRVAVAPDQQGRGVGSALLRAVEAGAPASVRRFQLSAAGRSAHNIRLYERLGYAEYDRGPDAVGTPMVFMAKARRPRLLLLTGSRREGSVSTAVLRTLADETAAWSDATLHDGAADLPHFDPDVADEDLDPTVIALRSAVSSAAAVVVSTPEYAGSLPGTFKNLLDWTVGGGEMLDRPVAWINPSAGPTGARGAYAALDTVLGYLGSDVVREACISVPVRRPMVGADGLVDDPPTRAALAAMGRTLAGVAGVVLS